MNAPADGYVLSRSEIEPLTNVKGHPNMNIYRFARPFETSRWLLVALNDVEEGGGIDLHYHEHMDADHAYFVIDGEVIAWIGEREFRVGPLSIMFFPTGTLHGFKVVSPGGARILRLGASPDGIATGNSVWVNDIAAPAD
jgi:mannose-6-phosphate isomerase-like protein (cupin superfamily)